jgi:peptide/nickel transport system ATP-binding protein
VALQASSEISSQYLLQVEDLTVGYGTHDRGQRVALEGVTFNLAAGESVGLLGESGSGKTTLGLALLGLLPPAGTIARGSALFRGDDLVKVGERGLQNIRGAAISMVHQEPGSALNPFLRVGEQIVEVIRAHRRLTRKCATEEADLLLTQVGLSTETAGAYPHQLSGGQQQRVALTQAIAAQPALLIADEPTTALDRVTQLEILDLLTRLRMKLQLTLLLITHDPDVLVRTVDRVMVMRDGRIVEHGPTREVLRYSRNTYTQTLVNASPASARQGGNVSAESSPHESSRARGNSPSDKAATLLSAVSLCKSYLQGRWPSTRRHRVDALRGVDLTLRAGSSLALIGASGSGKSTLARCLACLERPDSGEIWFEKTNLAGLTDRELNPFRRQVQMIFQDPGASLNPRMTAVEIVSEPLLTVASGHKKQSRDRALDLMGLVGLRPEWGDRLPQQFSAGQRRRLAVARALTLEPGILILDEALAGLDLAIQAQIADLLLELQAKLSLAYLYISHNLGLTFQLADQVIVLHQGQVVEATTSMELLARPQSPAACSLVRASLEMCAGD